MTSRFFQTPKTAVRRVVENQLKEKALMGERIVSAAFILGIIGTLVALGALGLSIFNTVKNSNDTDSVNTAIAELRSDVMMLENFANMSNQGVSLFWTINDDPGRIKWDFALWDDGFWDPGTPTDIVIPTAGRYAVGGRCVYSFDGPGDFILEITPPAFCIARVQSARSISLYCEAEYTEGEIVRAGWSAVITPATSGGCVLSVRELAMNP